ncbi:MAG: tetratricopeptide repeat protein, partial [Phycisphaeraceae bacterium]|nr:tetratricopeptide repeat protein [Phycisphaeraceae bacterium]
MAWLFATRDPAGSDRVDPPLVERLLNAVVSIGHYLWHTLDVRNLAAPYPWQPVSILVVAAIALSLLAFTVLAIGVRRRRPAVLAGWAWFLLALGPTLQIIPVGSFSMADRFTYLPGLGLLMILFFGLWPRRARAEEAALPPAHPAFTTLLAVVMATAAGAMTLITQRQISHWQNSETLFRHTLRVTGDENPYAWRGLAYTLQQQGRWAESEDAWRRTIDIGPVRPGDHVGLGITLARQDKPDAALEQFNQVLKDDPRHADALFNRGMTLWHHGNHPAAIDTWEKLLKYHPDDGRTYRSLAHAYRAADRHEAAQEAFARYRRLNPHDLDTPVHWARLQRKAGHLDAAEALLTDLLNRNPDHASAHNELAIVFGQQGNYPAARKHWQEVLRLDPDNETIREQLRRLEILMKK